MKFRFVTLLQAAAVLTPVLAAAAIHTPTLAAIEPPRVLSDARPPVAEIRQVGDGLQKEVAGLRADVARLEEALRREARLRDSWVQARFEEDHRKIVEVVSRLQIFVGCLIVLLLAIFIWLAELSRRVEKPASKKRPGAPLLARRSSGLG